MTTTRQSKKIETTQAVKNNGKMQHKYSCPSCGNRLTYITIKPTFKQVTERWWCNMCREQVVFHEPGLKAKI